MPTHETDRAKVVARLLNDGWILARHGAEHGIYNRVPPPSAISVPRHRTLSPGVARQIAKGAGWV